MAQARVVRHSMLLVGVASLQRSPLRIVNKRKGKICTSRARFGGSLWQSLPILVLIHSPHSHEDVGIGMDPMLLKAINR